MAIEFETVTFQEVTRPVINDEYGTMAARLALGAIDGKDITTPEDSAVVSYCAKMDSQIVYAALSPGNEFLGTGSMMIYRNGNRGNVANILDLAVNKGSRETGIGGQLLSHVEAKARIYGAYEAILEPEAEYIPFYEKRGYSEEARPYIQPGVLVYVKSL